MCASASAWADFADSLKDVDSPLMSVLHSGMIELRICIKQIKGTSRCELGAFQADPDSGTNAEKNILKAVITGVKTVFDAIASIHDNYSAIDLADPHSALAELIRERFKPGE